ncbi:MAG: TRAM domain-containing protein [Pirellulales bacterium]|nr:TRAM domain-containing protein [Pirellulales bacterium]
MALWVLRVVFVVVAAGLGIWIVKASVQPIQLPVHDHPIAIFLAVLGIAVGVIGLDMAVRRKRLDTISAVYFGLIVGLLLAYTFHLATTPLPIEPNVRDALQLVTGMVLCYLCISMLLQTRDDFRFIIPYVEFAREVKGLKPFVIDTSAIIDGRIADIIETRLFDSQLIVPRFVLAELQGIADSSDRLRRSRGRRGLDVLNRLRSTSGVDLTIYEREPQEIVDQPVDLKLVLLAKHLNAKVITGDYNLNKVAQLHDVGVINLNDLANALKPIFLPGEALEVRVVKPGEEPGQGVGYLDDGTMVVIEAGRDQVGRTVRIIVTSVLQTSAGRMVFGRFDAPAAREAPPAATVAAARK